MDGRVRAVTAALIPGLQSVGFDPPTTLSPATTNIALEDAAAGPAGSFAVAWFDLAGGRGSAAVAEVDGSGAVRTEAGPATGRVLFGTQVAYSPRTGRPTVVWSEGDAPQGYRIVAWTGP
jgi:hypothetical protein